MNQDGPKVIDLKATKNAAADKQAGSGGIAKLKDEIQGIKNLADVQKILAKIVKVMVD